MIRVAAIACIFTFMSSLADAARIKDLCEVQGARGNILRGIGLIVGLNGTGDNAEAAVQAQSRLLRRLQVNVQDADALTTDNAAVVIVTAEIPPFAKEGTRIDVLINSLYDAESLEGGTLLETMLEGIDGSVYAVAQGPISVGGFNADAGGGTTSVRENHVTVGRIPMGAFVEREIPSTITDGERIQLLLKRPDFGTADNIQQALNENFLPGTATALGAGTISVRIPSEMRANLVRFIAEVNEVSVESVTPTKVVINERTGTIVVGGNVIVKPCQVAHGALTITVARTPVISQPAPFSEEGVTVVDEINDIEAVQQEVRLMPIEGVSAGEVADSLNRLKVTPRDIIAIFQALRQAGVMDADLEII